MTAILELLDADALQRTASYADAYLVGRYQPPEDPSFLCDTHWCPLDANLTLPLPAQNPFEEVISRLCASPLFQAHVRRALRGQPQPPQILGRIRECLRRSEECISGRSDETSYS